MGQGEAALYTEDAAVARAARAAGLRPFGDYYDREGRLFARQFRGPAVAVKRVLAEVKRHPEEPILRRAPKGRR